MINTERQTVIGFTEAELGFFLAVLVVVIWVASVVQASGSTSAEDQRGMPAQISTDSLEHLLQEHARLTRLVDSLESPIWPTCKDRRLATGPLMTVISAAPGRFIVDADTVTIERLADRVRPSVNAGRRVRCVHEVRFGYRASGLTIPEHEANRRAIRRLSLRLLDGPVLP